MFINSPFFICQKEEERELAVIFLQQVIRGRAVQNMVRLLLHYLFVFSFLFCFIFLFFFVFCFFFCFGFMNMYSPGNEVQNLHFQ